MVSASAYTDIWGSGKFFDLFFASFQTLITVLLFAVVFRGPFSSFFCSGVDGLGVVVYLAMPDAFDTGFLLAKYSSQPHHPGFFLPTRSTCSSEPALLLDTSMSLPVLHCLFDFIHLFPSATFAFRSQASGFPTCSVRQSSSHMVPQECKNVNNRGSLTLNPAMI